MRGNPQCQAYKIVGDAHRIARETGSAVISNIKEMIDDLNKSRGAESKRERTEGCECLWAVANGFEGSSDELSGSDYSCCEARCEPV